MVIFLKSFIYVVNKKKKFSKCATFFVEQCIFLGKVVESKRQVCDYERIQPKSSPNINIYEISFGYSYWFLR